MSRRSHLLRIRWHLRQAMRLAIKVVTGDRPKMVKVYGGPYDDVYEQGVAAPNRDGQSSTNDWHTADPLHPSLLCKCGDVAPEQHLPDCPWAAAWCLGCLGGGHCSRCGGDGCEPTPTAAPSGEEARG